MRFAECWEFVGSAVFEPISSTKVDETCKFIKCLINYTFIKSPTKKCTTFLLLLGPEAPIHTYSVILMYRRVDVSRRRIHQATVQSDYSGGLCVCTG